MSQRGRQKCAICNMGVEGLKWRFSCIRTLWAFLFNHWRRMDGTSMPAAVRFWSTYSSVLPTRVANSNSSSKAKSIKFCSQIGRCKAKPITRHFSGQNVKSVEAKYLVCQALIQIPMQFQLSIQFYGAFKGTWDFFYFNRTKKK